MGKETKNPYLLTKFYQNGCPRSMLALHRHEMSCYYSWKTCTIQNTLQRGKGGGGVIRDSNH